MSSKSGGTGEAAGEPATDQAVVRPVDAEDQPERRTRLGAAWVAIIVAIIVLVLLLVFILQNLGTVTVSYFGASGQLPLGVALLFAAIGGAVLVAVAGVARLTQLRLNARRQRRARRRQGHEEKRAE